MTKIRKIGPRLPGGAFTTAHAATTKRGPCTVSRRVRRVTRGRSNGDWYGTFVTFRVDCGNYAITELTARTFPQFQKAFAGKYGTDPKAPLFFVGTVDTADHAKREGLATRAYEAMANYVCSRGGVLVSNSRMPGAKSNDFWKKQIEKGRARIVDSPRDGNPRDFSLKTVMLDCRYASDLSGIPRQRPRRKNTHARGGRR